jgi:hypothetical protein
VAERPAPLILIPAGTASEPSFGSHAAILETGRRLLGAELSTRLSALGAAVLPLRPAAPADGEAFHWGRWYAGAARRELAAGSAAPAALDAIGFAGAGSLALAGDALLDELLSPIPGEVVANNRYSADAFVVAGDLDHALDALATCPSDNLAPRVLADAGFAVRDLSGSAWSRFDVDTPLDLALLRLASRLPGVRALDPALAGFLEMATLPGGGRLEVPRLAELGEVVRDRDAELVLAGRVPAGTLAWLETETACRVRAFVEERGMRAAPGGTPRSLLADLLADASPAGLVNELARLGDGVVLDSRVLMAARAGSADAAAWPPAEERFASDFGGAARVATPWLAELTRAAAAAPVPVLLGGHGLVSDGIRILVGAAWLGH